MLSKEKLEQLLAILGDLTGEQKAIVIEALQKQIPDKGLFEKLDGVSEGRFADFMRAAAAQKEDAVLAQELSPDEMAGAAGGITTDCTQAYERDIYEGGFPNCAHTVENGSWCNLTDACHAFSVVYTKRKDCSKAWK